MAEADYAAEDLEADVTEIGPHTPELEINDPPNIDPDREDEMRSLIILTSWKNIGEVAMKAIRDALTRVFQFMVVSILYVLVFPFYLLYYIYWAWVEYGEEEETEDCNRDSSIIRKWEDRIRQSKYGMMARVGCLLLVWLPVTVYVPALKKSTVLGSSQWKWTLFLLTVSWATVFIDYIIYFICRSVVIAAAGRGMNGGIYGPRQQKYLMEYYIDKSTASLVGTLSLGLVLVTWLVYFSSSEKRAGSSSIEQKVLTYGTWTLVSLFVGGILWVVKSFLLLKWKLNAIYGRFAFKIADASLQMYLLANLVDYWSQSGLRKSNFIPLESVFRAVCDDRYQNIPIGDDDDTRDSHKSIRDWKEYMRPMTVEHLAKQVMRMARATCSKKDAEDAHHISEFQWECVSHLRELLFYPDKPISTDDLERRFKLNGDHQHENLSMMMKMLRIYKCGYQDDYSSVEASTLLSWLDLRMDTPMSCLAIGDTLIDSEAAANSLNLIMITFIVFAVVFIWLLITSIATTNILVVIVSPIIALSFMFGDTAKAFFQGVIFSFVSHPFNVGDRCTIDGIEMVVKQMGILNTKFKMTGSGQHVLYPNSQLATKTISINRDEARDSDPAADVIELEFDYATGKTFIRNLGMKIDRYLRNYTSKFEARRHLSIIAIGDKIKLTIRFTHVLDKSKFTRSSYIEQKTEGRSIFLTAVLEMLDDPDSNTPTSATGT